MGVLLDRGLTHPFAVLLKVGGCGVEMGVPMDRGLTQSGLNTL